MLVELSIRDLALIETAELRLGPGLNAITGETGAGKSLFVASLELLRGETPRGGAAQWVRKGAPEARVEGRFELVGDEAIAALREVLRAELPAVAEGWEASLDPGRAELILGRSLSSEGRTRAHVQQRPVPLRALRAIAPLVLEIHGQNDHQRLLVPAEQLRLLDAYGKIDRLLGGYKSARGAWIELVERLSRLDAERVERRDRVDLLRFQVSELRAAGLEPGEHDALREERELLRGAEELRAELGGWVHAFVEADGATVGQLRSAEQALERWVARIPSLATPLEDLRSAGIHLQEAATALASVVAGVSADPTRLEVVEERLAELERLEHKYQANEEGLVELGTTLAAELEALEADEQGHDEATSSLAEARAETEVRAAQLADARRELAPRLAQAVLAALRALGLGRARFDVAFVPRAGPDTERFGPRGSENVELLLAANPGEEPRPLRQVASGGEAARIMLALRTVLGCGSSGRTLVFDEIDAGVGGRLGPAVGSHLRELGERDQVLCVTHVPAIAAMARLHLGTSKEVRGGRTRTTIEALRGDARVSEVADMIAGGAGHETARAEARRLLGAAPVG